MSSEIEREKRQFEHGYRGGYVACILDIWRIFDAMPEVGDEASLIVTKIATQLNDRAREDLEAAIAQGLV